MSIQIPTSDSGLLDLLRIAGALSVSELSDAMEVTPTAVHQRLVRLLAHNAIQREAIWHGRGRPRYRYWLTEKGLSLTDSNFTDLAMTFWQETGQPNVPEAHRQTLRQIARALANGYASQIRGETPAERLQSLAELLNERRIPALLPCSATPPQVQGRSCCAGQ